MFEVYLLFRVYLLVRVLFVLFCSGAIGSDSTIRWSDTSLVARWGLWSSTRRGLPDTRKRIGSGDAQLTGLGL
jgi:hypothetical protein